MADKDDKTTTVAAKGDDKAKSAPADASGFVQVPKDEYEGLKTKVGELGTYIDSTKDFIDGASVVINTLAYTPELRTAFQESLKKQYTQPGQNGVGQQPAQSTQTETTTTSDKGQAQATDGVVEKKVEDVATAQRVQIVEGFEKDYGIMGLSKEDRKQTRQAIEGYLNEFGWSTKTAPLAALRGVLEKAYMGTRVDKLKEEGKLEGIAQFRQNQLGMMGNASGGAPEETSQSDLSPAQKAWAEKLGVDVSKAKETYLARDKEEKRVPKSEKS